MSSSCRRKSDSISSLPWGEQQFGKIRAGAMIKGISIGVVYAAQYLILPIAIPLWIAFGLLFLAVSGYQRMAFRKVYNQCWKKLNGPIGFFSFFKNRIATFSDIMLLSSFACGIVLYFLNLDTVIGFSILFGLFTYSVQVHSYYNGRVYRQAQRINSDPLH